MAARWPLFAGVAGTVLILLVALAHLSAEAIPDGERGRSPNGGAVVVDDSGVRTEHPSDSEQRVERDRESADSRAEYPDSEARRVPSEEQRKSGTGLGELETMSTPALLVNVALSQGLLGTFLVLGAWYAEIPLAAFGVVVGDPWSFGLPALGLGLGFGVALYAVNELLGNLVEDLGIDFSEELREALAPESLAGWLALLIVVLPTIAAFEEILFRAALVGALSAGFGLSPWLLAVFSSAAFAIGHGLQGPGGIVVTGLLGFVLAAAFVLTESLLVVIAAHYVVNALEFVVHEGLGLGSVRKA